MPDNTAMEEAARLVNKCGGRTLRFSKISVVGQGCAGKSSLIRSMLGKDFKVLGRTAGVKSKMIEVCQHHLEIGSKEWAKYEPQNKSLLAEAKARMVAEVMLRAGTASADESLPEESQRSMVDILRQEDIPADSTLTQSDQEVLEGVSAGAVPALDGSERLEQALVGPDIEKLDQTLVQRFLSSKCDSEEPMKLLVEDFGGQDCFYELYSILFSQNAVYVLVFNMEWLLDGSSLMAEGLDYIRHWLFTVQVYCRRPSIILVGTHKDRVRDQRQQTSISNLLRKELEAHPSWERVVKNTGSSWASGDLFFFPVDNMRGRNDQETRNLMRVIEQITRQSEHLKYKVPFAWLALLDKIEELKESSRRVLETSEFLEICKAVGFPSSASLDVMREMVLARQFLSRLGLLMYHESVPHLVILKPSEFLFPYLTKIICDYDVHSCEEHRTAQKVSAIEFNTLKEKGIISANLFEVLWKGCDYKEELRTLMISLGLMVQIKGPIRTEPKGEEIRVSYQDPEFLVPSILPVEPNPVPPPGTCLIARAIFAVAETVESWERLQYIETHSVEKGIYVPDGVFSRLLGSVASLCQHTEPYTSIRELRICKNSCFFQLGGSTFTLVNHRDNIGIYIEKGSGHEITQTLHWQIKALVTNFVPGFDFRIFVASKGGGFLRGSAYESFRDVNEYTILTGEMGIKEREIRKERMLVKKGEILTSSQLRDRYHEWVATVFCFLKYTLIRANEVT